MVLSVLCALALAAAPMVEPIRGRVELRHPPPPAAPGPDTAGALPPARRGVPDRWRSVVFLETAPRGAFEDPGRPTAVLDQRDETFVPWVLPIVAGTTVSFPNSDVTYHNVFSLSKPRRFDLGRYPRGESRSVRFDRPGVVRVFCEIHSHMNAWILVFAHRYFATTDAEGRYELPGAPPGRYVLVVWHDGEERARREVTLPGGPFDFTLD